MISTKVLTILSAVMFCAGFVPYIRSILRGQTTPAAASWISWLILDVVIIVSMAMSGTASGVTIGATCGTIVVVYLALTRGTGGWGMFDRFCLATGIVSALIVLATVFVPKSVVDLSSVGLGTSLFGLFIGCFPTVKSAWKDPHHENFPAWTLFAISSVIGLFAAPSNKFTDMAPAIMFVANTGLIYSIIIFRRLTA